MVVRVRDGGQARALSGNRALGKAVTVVVLCMIWYVTSTRNTVGTQKFVQHMLDSGTDESPMRFVDRMGIMAVFTTLQLGGGALLSSTALLAGLQITKCCRKQTKNHIDQGLFLKNVFRLPPMESVECWVALFHALGSTATNMGFVFGRAVIVIIVKLMEPIETLILTTLVSRHNAKKSGSRQYVTHSNLTILSVFLVTGGAIGALVLFKPNKNSSSLDSTVVLAVAFSLISGLALSCRNVFKKTANSAALQSEELKSLFNGPLQKSLFDFARLSFQAWLVCLLYSIVVVPFPEQWMLIARQALESAPLIFYHSLYNMASLMVLEYVSAPTHSLLNVGKRYFNVIVAMVVFHDAMKPAGIGGLFLSAIGSVLYAHEKSKTTPLSSPPADARSRADFSHHQQSTKEENPKAKRAATRKKLLPALFLPVALSISRLRQQQQLEMQGPLERQKPREMQQGSMATVDVVEVRNECIVKFKDPSMSLCYYNTLNFGDELGPVITEKLLENHFGCPVSLPHFNIPNRTEGQIRGRCLFVLGSVFHFTRNFDHIWGIGINPSAIKYKNIPAYQTIYSVRGPKTLAKLIKYRPQLVPNNESNFGDAGILVTSIFPEFKVKQTASVRKFCFVAHKRDGNHPFVNNPPNNLKVILCNQTWRSVVEEIGSCSHVSSSSLHGIITADAFGIPRQWFQFPDTKTRKTEGRFKYKDYFYSIPQKNVPRIEHTSGIFDVRQYSTPLTESEITAMQERTLASFPFQLFNTTRQR